MKEFPPAYVFHGRPAHAGQWAVSTRLSGRWGASTPRAAAWQVEVKHAAGAEEEEEDRRSGACPLDTGVGGDSASHKGGARACTTCPDGALFLPQAPPPHMHKHVVRKVQRNGRERGTVGFLVLQCHLPALAAIHSTTQHNTHTDARHSHTATHTHAAPGHARACQTASSPARYKPACRSTLLPSAHNTHIRRSLPHQSPSYPACHALRRLPRRRPQLAAAQRVMPARTHWTTTTTRAHLQCGHDARACVCVRV